MTDGIADHIGKKASPSSHGGGHTIYDVSP